MALSTIQLNTIVSYLLFVTFLSLAAPSFLQEHSTSSDFYLSFRFASRPLLIDSDRYCLEESNRGKILAAAFKLFASFVATKHTSEVSLLSVSVFENKLAIAATMDPFSQNFTLVDGNGQTLTISMADIALLNYENVEMALIYGVQIGLSVLMLTTLLLLTQPGKRQSPVFILNVLALTLNTIRASLLATYLTSNWDNPYSILAADYSRITKMDVANSVAVSVIKFAEVIVIEISFLLQVHVVLSTASRLQRFWLLILSGTVGMIAVAFQLATTIVNSIALQGYKTSDGIVPPDQARVASAANISFTISVCFFMAIFVSKLGYALKERRTLGLRKFGPMQVIFIMGLQTMIVPCKF
jgi:pheromone alpha factor receptor